MEMIRRNPTACFKAVEAESENSSNGEAEKVSGKRLNKERLSVIFDSDR